MTSKPRFALGDATRVAWGTTTADQYRRRVAMLHGQIVGTAETASRHVASVKMMIQQAGATCPADIANGASP